MKLRREIPRRSSPAPLRARDDKRLALGELRLGPSSGGVAYRRAARDDNAEEFEKSRLTPCRIARHCCGKQIVRFGWTAPCGRGSVTADFYFLTPVS